MAMVALMTGQVAQALRLSSIGAVSNGSGTLGDTDQYGYINRFGQIASFEEDVDEYVSLVQSDKT